MNHTLVINYGSDLDRTLELLWVQSDIDEWEMFVGSLSGVSAVELNRVSAVTGPTLIGHTTITFESEEHKNWFLLEYA